MQLSLAISTLSASLRLFGRGWTWLALIVLTALGFYSFRSNLEIASSGGFDFRAFASVAMIAIVVKAAVQFILARKLGGERGTAQRPNLLTWMGLTVVPDVAVYAISMGIALLAGKLVISAFPLAVVMMLGSLLTQIALFPIHLRLAATVHSGNMVTLREIWERVAGHGTGFFVGYIMLRLALTVPTIVRMATFKAEMVQYTNGDVLLKGLEGGVILLLPMLYAVVAYREICRTRLREADVF